MPYPYRSLRDWIAEEEQAGNVLRTGLPLKCGDYSNLVDIGNGVEGKQPQTRLRAFLRYLHSLPGKPIGIIEKPINNRPDIPLVENLWPTRERTLRGLGCRTKDEFCLKLQNVLASRVKPVKVPKNAAPCKEVIIPEAGIDLTRNIPRTWVEFNQWGWAGCNGTILLYDPETRTHGLGKARAGVFDYRDGNPDKPYPPQRVKRQMLGTMSWASGFIASNTGAYFYNRFKAKNRPMPATWIFGVPTDVHVLASLKSMRWPATGDEYEVLGGLRGQPVELVESETIPGLMVPAHAEWVIEGEFLPEVETVPRYAMDVYRGYLHGDDPFPVFNVKCITHRRNPIWDAATFSSSGLHGHDGNHIGLQTITMEGAKINYLRSLGYRVKDVVATSSDMMIDVIQVDADGAAKPEPHYGKTVAMALASAVALREWAKYIIVVGPDVDPYDLTDVLWAVGSRTMPVSDTVVSRNPHGAWGYERAMRAEETQRVNLLFGEQVLIDALVKVPERYDSWPPRSDPAEWEANAISEMKKDIEAARGAK